MKLYYTCSPWVKDVPYWFLGQTVKGQGHEVLVIENGFRSITYHVIDLWSWNFIHLLLMSKTCAILIFIPTPTKLWGVYWFHHGSVRRYVCLSVCGKVAWIGWDIFDFFSDTAERNSTKLDRKQDLNVLYQVCVFSGGCENQDGGPGLWLAETIRLLWKCWTEFKEAWQEARS